MSYFLVYYTYIGLYDNYVRQLFQHRAGQMKSSILSLKKTKVYMEMYKTIIITNQQTMEREQNHTNQQLMDHYRFDHYIMISLNYKYLSRLHD